MSVSADYPCRCDRTFRARIDAVLKLFRDELSPFCFEMLTQLWGLRAAILRRMGSGYIAGDASQTGWAGATKKRRSLQRIILSARALQRE